MAPDSITERAAIRVSISNLLTFPWVHERVEQGTLTVHGWLFDLREGVLYGLDPATDAYVRLA